MKEDAVVEEMDASAVELSSAGQEPYEVLRPAMKAMCLGYDVPFQGMLEAVEESDEDTFAGVKTVFWDPTYNTGLIAELLNSEHHRLSLQDMRNLCSCFWQ